MKKMNSNKILFNELDMFCNNFKKINLTDTSWILEGTLPEKLLPSETLFNQLWEEHPAKRPIIHIYGKEITCPRWNESYLQSYAFSGQISMANREPHTYYTTVLNWINSRDFSDDKVGKFNQILINWYENGHDYIGAHSDDESQLRNNSSIVTISLGATRTFRIRPKQRRSEKRDFELDNGSIIIMGGDMQSQFTHEIVKINGKKGAQIKKRISITLRKFKE